MLRWSPSASCGRAVAGPASPCRLLGDALGPHSNPPFENNVKREDYAFFSEHAGVAEFVVESRLLTSRFPFLKEGFAYGIKEAGADGVSVFGLISEFTNNSTGVLVPER